MSRQTRRRFLKQSAALAGVASTPAFAVPMVVQDRNANSKLGIAVIGCGGQGGENPRRAAGERLVALVDVDDNKTNKTNEAILRVGARANRVPTFHDYRRMYDAVG